MDSIKKLINFKNIILAIAVFAIIIAVLGFSGKIPLFNSTSTQKLTGTVNVWGTLPSSSMSNFVDKFNKTAKTYNMIYTEVEHDKFNDKLIRAIASGAAPDLIIAPSDITFANMDHIYPISPSTQLSDGTTLSESVYRNIFIDESSLLIDMPKGYLAFPISVDPLLLYYNRDILSSYGFSAPPSTWTDLYKYNEKITQVDSKGNFSLSTIAFGTYDNIPHISDIILSMILQQGQIPVEKTSSVDVNGNSVTAYNVLVDTSASNDNLSPLNQALAYTKDFSDSQKSTYDWNSKSDDAMNSFISGNLAFYIGPASEANTIKYSNQKLYLDYTYLPQWEGSKTSTTYGSMYTIFMLNTSSGVTQGVSSLAYRVMVALATGSFSQDLVGMTGGVSALKSNIISSMSSGDQFSEISGQSALISKGFYDLHRSDLENLMKESIRQINNGEKSTVEASRDFSDNLQAVYDSANE